MLWLTCNNRCYSYAVSLLIIVCKVMHLFYRRVCHLFDIYRNKNYIDKNKKSCGVAQGRLKSRTHNLSPYLLLKRSIAKDSALINAALCRKSHCIRHLIRLKRACKTEANLKYVLHTKKFNNCFAVLFLFLHSFFGFASVLEGIGKDAEDE